MNRAKTAVCMTVLAAPFLLAMGFLGDPPALEKAPEPAIRLDAVMLDSEGTSTRVTHVSYDGALYLPVYRGKALITVPLEQILRIDFGPKKSSTRQVTVHFKERPGETFFLDLRVLFVGKVPFGTYQIQVKDLERITFVEPGSAPGGPENGAPGDAHAP